MAAKKKTTKKKSSKRLDTMSHTHGMVEKFEPTSLNQIWGDDGMSKYGTLDAKEYEKQLRVLTRTDLGAHAQKIGLVPIDNSSLLIERLLAEFNRHANSFKKPVSEQENPLNMDPETRKILEEGR